MKISLTMSISKILTDLCAIIKKKFCRYCLQRFTSERVLIDHKENCLIINDKQRNKWQIKGKIRKYFNQI